MEDKWEVFDFDNLGHLFFSAFLGGTITFFSLQFFEVSLSGWFNVLHGSIIAGALGIISALPLLIIAFTPWFNWQATKNGNIFLWHAVPVILSVCYAYFGILIFNYQHAFDLSYRGNIYIFKLYGFTALLTAFFMWIDNKRQKSKEAQLPQNFIEETNANH
jgi:hypothetical protein